MKKVVIPYVLIIILVIGGLFVYYNLPIYVRYEAIFKGYSDYNGREYLGKDADIYYIFDYSEEDIEKFAESDLYKEVVCAKDISKLKKLVKDFESYSYDYEPFSDLISIGDYYKVRIFGYISIYHFNFEVYFFDTDTQKLYYLYQTM